MIKRKKFVITLFVVAIVVVVLILGVLCVLILKNKNKSQEYAFDRVLVYIDIDYKQQFENQEFTIEDFKWANIEKIVYKSWSDESGGLVEVYLKSQGKRRVKSAVKHLKQLSFVADAKLVGYIFAV